MALQRLERLFTIRLYQHSRNNHGHFPHIRRRIHMYRNLSRLDNYRCWKFLSSNIQAGPFLHYYDRMLMNYIGVYDNHLEGLHTRQYRNKKHGDLWEYHMDH